MAGRFAGRPFEDRDSHPVSLEPLAQVDLVTHAANDPSAPIGQPQTRIERIAPRSDARPARLAMFDLAQPAHQPVDDLIVQAFCSGRGGSIHNGRGDVSWHRGMVIRRRKRTASGRPWVALEDAKLALALPLLWAFALTVPERRWRTLCYRLESVRARVNTRDLDCVARAAERVVGSHASFEGRAFALEIAAGATEHNLRVLRAAAAVAGTLAASGGRGASRPALARRTCLTRWPTSLQRPGNRKRCTMPYRLALSRPGRLSKSTRGSPCATAFGPPQRATTGRIPCSTAIGPPAAVAAMRVLAQNGILSITPAIGKASGCRHRCCGGEAPLAVRLASHGWPGRHCCPFSPCAAGIGKR